MKKKITAVLIACFFIVLTFASCGASNVFGREYKVSEIKLKFNGDASTLERSAFLDAVRTLADDEKMNEKKALKWTEDFAYDLSSNYTLSFDDKYVTENFFEMSTDMVKETDEEKIIKKKEALNVIGESIFNLTVCKYDDNGEVTDQYYNIELNGGGLKVTRTATAESKFIVDAYARYIRFTIDKDHPANNSDGYISQAFTKGDTLMYSSGKIKQTIEKDGFVAEITYKKK